MDADHRSGNRLFQPFLIFIRIYSSLFVVKFFFDCFNPTVLG
jgi:hypothetical protein